MALNERQRRFVQDLKLICRKGVEIARMAPELIETYNEEFDTSQDNDLANEEATLEGIGLSSAVIAAAVNQYVTAFDKFWTNQAVSTREYGKDARRIAD